MKALIKIWVVVLFFFFTGAMSLLSAQPGLGVRGGVNFGTAELKVVLNGTHSEPDYNPGISAALIGEFEIMDYLAVQPELAFSQKGYKVNETIIGTVIETKTVLNYVEMPLLLKGKFGNEMIKGFALAGPVFGYVFDGVVKSGGEKDNIDFDGDKIRQTEFGLIFGLGASVKAGPGAFFLDGRYGLGLTNLEKEQGTYKKSWKNRGFGIGAGYIYMIR